MGQYERTFDIHHFLVWRAYSSGAPSRSEGTVERSELRHAFEGARLEEATNHYREVYR